MRLVLIVLAMLAIPVAAWCVDCELDTARTFVLGWPADGDTVINLEDTLDLDYRYGVDSLPCATCELGPGTHAYWSLFLSVRHWPKSETELVRDTVFAPQICDTLRTFPGGWSFNTETIDTTNPNTAHQLNYQARALLSVPPYTPIDLPIVRTLKVWVRKNRTGIGTKAMIRN